MHSRAPLRLASAVVLLGLAAAAAAGCSKRAAPPTRATTSSLVVQAGAHAHPDGSLYFRQLVLRAPAGSVTVLFTNPAALEHNLAVRRGAKQLGVTTTIANGKSAQLSLRLMPGRYVFFCAVPGHEASGMRGALIIT